MLKKSLIDLLFKGFSIVRWNDKLRPIDLIQIDKHSHKMMIAYCLAKYEEEEGYEFEWLDIIKGGIYELIRRNVISDIQSPVFKEISKNKELVKKLNFMIFKEVENKFTNEEIKQEFKSYMTEDDYIHPHSQKILDAAHIYSTYYEFLLVRNANPEGYKIDHIHKELVNEIEKYKDLKGIQNILNKQKIKNFVDLTGELRYQVRWGHLPRIPNTSVLGHTMLVACLSYFFTKQIPNVTDRRIYNNFWGGIFHDLPEVVTRDIIKPVKRSVPGMQEEIKRIEEMLAEQEIFPQLEPEWLDEIKFFTRDEFTAKINDGEIVDQSEMNSKYNEDKYNPYDGTLLKVADDFAAFLEAQNSIDYGIKSRELAEATQAVRRKYAGKVIADVPVYKLFEEYDSK
jgi:putative hydrolase of HD superfamily